MWVRCHRNLYAHIGVDLSEGFLCPGDQRASYNCCHSLRQWLEIWRPILETSLLIVRYNGNSSASDACKLTAYGNYNSECLGCFVRSLFAQKCFKHNLISDIPIFNRFMANKLFNVPGISSLRITPKMVAFL